MKTLNFYEVMQNMDGTEGRGPIKGTGIAFETKDDAIEFCNPKRYGKYAVMGVVSGKDGHHDVEKKNVFIFNSTNDYDENYGKAEKIEKAEAAFKKLNGKDIEAIKEYFLTSR